MFEQQKFAEINSEDAATAGSRNTGSAWAETPVAELRLTASSVRRLSQSCALHRRALRRGLPGSTIYQTDIGPVLHHEDTCSCGHCFYACPFGAAQVLHATYFGSRGTVDGYTYCAGGPEENGSKAEYREYGRNPIAEEQSADLRLSLLDPRASGR